MLIFEIMDKKNIPQFSVLPKHIGIIMDGNGRWAKQRNLPRYKGHIEGAKTFRRIGEFAADVGVKCLTFYAFSTENWKRPQEEVDAIMQLFREYLIEADERTEENKEKGITLRFIGDRTGIPEDIQALMEHIENVSKYETKVVLNLAVNYGGRHEITQGVKAIAEKVAKGEISPDEFKNFIGEDMRLERVRLRKDDLVKELLEFYMGKNTMERQNFIIDNLVVEEDITKE